MKFFSSLILLLSLAASVAGAQVSAKKPEVKTVVRTITIKRKKVVVSRRTEHVTIVVHRQSAAILSQGNRPQASKSLTAPNSGNAFNPSAATVHPRYGGPSGVKVSSQNFGTATIGGTPTVITLSFTPPVTNNTFTFSMFAGINFKYQSTACSTQSCTVQLAFAPTLPGPLFDTLSVIDTNGNLIDQVFVSGIGSGPEFGFLFGTDNGYYGLAGYPTGVAVGPDGTFYAMDRSSGTVTRVNFGGQITSFTIANLCNAAGIAVDGAGTVYVADPTFNQVVAYSAAGVQTVMQTTPLNSPTWVAVDGSGALYISDSGNGRIIKLDNQNVETTVISGLNSPQGLAVDGSGNLFFADQGNGGEIQEWTASTSQITSIDNDFGAMGGVALDAAGRVYFTTTNTFGIINPATGDIYTSETDGDGPFGVAVSPNGDILTSQAQDGNFDIADVSTGDFSLGTQIQSTAAGTLTIANNGNLPLSLTALAVGGPVFSIDSSTQCSSETNVAPATTCDVTVDFTPPNINNYQDTLTATSNSLNASGTQNNFSLSGSGTGAYTFTQLNVSPQSPALGAAVTFTANVSADSDLPSPTGTVSFLDGSSQLGSVNLSDGTAVFTTSSLSAGNHTVYAVYSGDSYNSPSTSYMNEVTVGIGSTNAGTNLTVSAANIGLNQPETLTVSVTADGATPTGTVTFLDGGNQVGTATLSGGSGRASASLTLSSLSGGTHGFYVTYSGDPNYAQGTSNTQNVTVAKGTSSTTLALSPTSPSTEQLVTFTATVASGTNPSESGLVFFSDQNGTLGYGYIQPSSTGGTATATAFLSAGSHQIKALYTQDTSYSDSTSPTQTVMVSQGTPYLNLNVSAASIKPGQTEILTLQIGNSDPFGEPGTVTFSDQNGVLGTGTACACYSGNFSTLQLTTLSPGIHSITGTYGGDSNYGGATTSPLTVTVSGASGSTTTTTLSVSSATIASGQTETLTATVLGGTSPAETGTVTFADQNGTFGSAAVIATSSGSTATLSLTNLSVGTHQITATYSGDGNYGPSTSAQQTVTVSSGSETIPTSTALTLSSTSISLGSPETFTATVGANGNGPSGSVTFSDQNGVIIAANLVVGDSTSTASATYTGLSFGSHQVTATYSGTGSYSSSTSAAQTVSVGPATSTTSLSVNPATATVGQAVTLTGSVQSYTSPALNGVISFADQNGGLGFSNITPNSTGGAASLTLTSLSAGVHQITAAYNNDYEHAYSISSPQTVTITQGTAAATTTTLIAPTSVAYKAPIGLRASITSANAAVTGQVLFCDASAPRCVPEQSLAIAQIVSPGVATVMLPAGTIGAHSYIAKFLGTTAFAASTSAAQSVTVTGTYPSTTTIASTGSAGSYTLTGTVVGLGSGTLAPTGAVTFNDTTNTGNPPLGNSVLGAGTLGFTAVSASGSPSKTGAGSYGVATGDLNGDGFMDVVVENYSANTISVLLGNGDGTFKPQVSYSVGSLPERVLIADFNGDGIPDIVVANTGSNAVGILLGNGDGTFKTQVTYGASSPVGLGVMDLNHDGIADIVAGDYYSNTISVLLGNGDGTFKAAVTYATGGTPQTLAEGDFNGDGNVDIAVGNLAGNTVGIFLGNGDGTFQTQVTYPVGRAPQGVQVGDFNGDGYDDLAVSNSTDNTISVLIGNGNGTFLPQVTYPVGADPVGLVVADFNGDGKQDLSVGNTAQSALTQSILLGNGDGTFQPQLTFKTGNFPYGEAVADFNGDGFPDLAISDFSDATATILLSEVTETATATLANVTLTGGTHNLDAVYPGDTNYAASTSQLLPLTVSNAIISPGTSTTVANGGVAPGSPSDYTFFGNTNVEFGLSGGGQPTNLTDFTVSVLQNVEYPGNGNYTRITAPGGTTPFTTGTVTENPTNYPTTTPHTTLLATFSPLKTGTFTVYILDGNTDGVYVGNSTVGLGVNGGAQVTTASNALSGTNEFSSYTVTNASPTDVFQVYATTSTNAYPTIGALTFSIPLTATSTSLTISPTTQTAGSAVIFTATISSSGQSTILPSGTVTLTSGSTTLGTITLTNGTGTLSLTNLAAGNYSVIGTYSGDARYAASSSPAQTLTVYNPGMAGTTITLTAPATVAYKSPISLSASVKTLTGAAVTSGQVIFCFAAATPCSPSLALATTQLNANGAATVRLTPGAFGVHLYTAKFLGTNSLAVSTSTIASVTVTGTYPTSSTLAATGIPGAYSLTDTLVATGNVALAPTGTIAFNDTTTGTSLGTATLGASMSSVSLINLASPSTGNEPTFIASGDFNADGYPDLAVANYGTPGVPSSGLTLTILLNRGDGTFTAAPGPAVPAGAFAIAVGDFNADGKLDLAVTNGSNAVTLLFGNGDGTFTAAGNTLATGNGAYGVVAADFNGDGNADLAVANQSDNTLTVLLGKGDGTFTTQPAISLANAGPTALTAADFNNDGVADLAIANIGSQGLTLLLGKGDGTFTSVSTTNLPTVTGGNLPAIASGDFNADGIRDLALSNSGANSTLSGFVLLGKGDGTFALASNLPTDITYASSLAISDFNGDGKSDIALTDDQTTRILLSNGDGTFTPAATDSAGNNDDPDYRVIAIADFNGDGVPDLAFLNSDLNALTIALTQLTQTASATLTGVSLTAPSGNHSVTASYPGSSSFAASTSAPITLVSSSLATSATTLTVSPATAATGQSITFTASVTGSSQTSISPTGTVAITNTAVSPAVTLGTITLANGTGSFSTSTLAAGTYTIVASYSGNTVYAASSSTAQLLVISNAGPIINSKNFGSVAVGATPLTLTLNYTFPTTLGGVLASLAYGTSFNTQSNTCSTTVCTVQVLFTPTFPGLAVDALSLKDTSGNLIAKTFLYGTGTAPQLGYDLAYGIFNTYSGTIKSPTSVAVGTDGNLLVGDTATNQVYKVTAGSYSGGTALAITGLGKPAGIAVSGDSTIYVADQTNNVIRTLNTITSAQGVVTTSSLFTPTGVAVDGTGAIYISDTGHGRIIKIDNQGTETTVVSGLTSPGGIALDGTGDLFYADPGSGGEITEIPVSGGASVSVGKNLGSLGDIAVAPSGRVYFASTKSVSSILNGTVYTNGYFNLSGNPVNYGMALDRFQDIITTNTSGGVLAVTGRTSSSFVYGTPVGTTNTCCDSIENTGNSPLTVAGLSNNGAAYTIHTGGGECVAGQVLQPTQTCGVALDFSPTAFQNYSDTLTVTSNSLNAAGSTNNSYLQETGQQIPTSIALTVSPNPARVGQTITFTATLGYNSTYATLPTGTVKLLNADGSTLATVPVSGLTAQYTTSTLAAGSYSVTASYSGDTAFVASASAAKSFTVTLAAVTLSSVSPASGALGSAATTVTLTGTNFSTGDVVQLNGTTISSSYVNATTLTAVIPASFFAKTGTGLITVFDPVSQTTSGSVTFTVANTPQIVFTGPSSSTSGAQPTLTFQLVNPYPVPLAGTLTLTFTPLGSAGVDDPAVQFATGGRTLPFNIPANSTATPTVQLQTGTVAGTVTIALTVTANGVNVTPATVAPVVITIPAAAPTITSSSVTRSGNTLTVSIVGFSNTRETTQAVFHFTPVPGATLNNPDLTLTVTPTFATWYASTASATYGSSFTYTQIFTLDQDASVIQSVTVTLANTIGTSAVTTTQ